MSDELEDILEELKNDDSISTLNDQPSAEKLDINDENVNDYIMQKVGRLIESGLDTVEAIQQTIASGFEPEELQAFSGLMTAITNAANTLNKINVENKKAKNAKELKNIDIEAKKELGNGETKGGNTNVLIATREEIMKQFLNNNKKILDAEYTEETIEDDDE